jgi:aryl-alcohol dehydrogenase-like predicted oxidoreductase
MKYQSIPQTDLHPSVLCFGTASFGTALDSSTAFRLLDTFFAQGGTFLDTAHVYGAWVPGGLGRSETIIGNWLHERHLREQVILGTKGAHPALSAMHLPRLSRQDIVADLDESLRCLRTEYIDLYWLHRDDPQRPVAELLETLNDQVRQGKIRSFGCSNWRVERVAEAMQYATTHHLAGFVCNQLMWSLAVPNREAIEDKTMVTMDASAFTFHQEVGLPIVAYTPQAHGFFSKASNQAGTLPDALQKWYSNEENRERLRRLQTVSRELSLSIPVLLLAYLTSQSVLTFPVFSCRNDEQLRENMQAGEVELASDVLHYLEHGS